MKHTIIKYLFVFTAVVFGSSIPITAGDLPQNKKDNKTKQIEKTNPLYQEFIRQMKAVSDSTKRGQTVQPHNQSLGELQATADEVKKWESATTIEGQYQALLVELIRDNGERYLNWLRDQGSAEVNKVVKKAREKRDQAKQTFDIKRNQAVKSVKAFKSSANAVAANKIEKLPNSYFSQSYSEVRREIEQDRGRVLSEPESAEIERSYNQAKSDVGSANKAKKDVSQSEKAVAVLLNKFKDCPGCIK